MVNLPSEKLSVKEQKQLEMGLEFSFVEKNKHLKKQLAAILKLSRMEQVIVFIIKTWKIFMNF